MQISPKRWHLPATTIAAVLTLGLPLANGQGKLVWSDEFDGTSLNTNDWEYMIGDGSIYGLPGGWGNNELQCYTSSSQNISVSGGVLHIVAIEEQVDSCNYSSARIRTMNNQEFLYGRFEARIKMPKTQGIWPAFWMLPTNSPYAGWAANGEIDIMETKNDVTVIGGTLHFGGQWPANTYSGGTYAPGTDYSADFHVFRLDWEPDVMRWYVDDVLYHTEVKTNWYSTSAPGNDRAPFDSPFHLLLNVAVGGFYPGNPDGSSTFPQEMQVDWVRVYEYEEQPPIPQSPYLGTAIDIPGQVEAEFFDIGGENLAYHDCDAANNGGDFRLGEGVDCQTSDEGGFNVGWMCAGEWMEYTVDVGADGKYRVASRVASETTGGDFHLEFDGVDKTGSVNVPVTLGWQAWTSVYAVVQLSAGEQIMRFVNGNTSDEYNLSYFDFTLLSPADLDTDGDVDADDYTAFAACLAGPGISIPPGGCTQPQFEAADLDDDGDVDHLDFALLGAAH